MNASNNKNINGDLAGLYINPIRVANANYILNYNPSTSEIAYNENVYCNNVYATTAVYANNVQLTSDYRIKEDIKSLDAKFQVDYLNPVTYINKQTKKQDIGLIAHELQEIYPELVSGLKDGAETQTINYIGLIPILINEMKNMKNYVKNLENRIEQLEK